MNMSVSYQQKLETRLPDGKTLQLVGDGDFEPAVLDQYCARSGQRETALVGLSDPRLKTMVQELAAGGAVTLGPGWDSSPVGDFQGRRSFCADSLGADESENRQRISARVEESGVRVLLTTHTEDRKALPGEFAYVSQDIEAVLDPQTGQILKQASPSRFEVLEGALVSGKRKVSPKPSWESYFVLLDS